MFPDCRLTLADSENSSICDPTTICGSSNLPILQSAIDLCYEGSCTSSSGSVCSMFVSSDAGRAGAAAGAGRGALRVGAAPRVELRRGVARFALRFMLRFALLLADRCAVIFRDAVFFEALRDVTAVFAAFRRFLAMRAPPVEMGARILSDKLIVRAADPSAGSLLSGRRCRLPRARRAAWRRHSG
jgi:hypothetical protein